MEENAYLLTLQLQLDSCMDSLLKRTTAEITALVRDKFALTQNNVSGENEKRLASNPNNPEKQSEKSKAEKSPVSFGEPETGEERTGTEILLEFQTQLTSCMDCLLKQAMVDIIAWIKSTVVNFHDMIAAKEAEIRKLAEQLHILETQTQVAVKAASFGSSEDHPNESPAVFEEIQQIESDAVGLEQDGGAASARNVPEAACFVEAEPALDYELTVATTVTGDDGEKEAVVLAGARGAEAGGGCPPQVREGDAAAPLQGALELGAAPHSCSQCWKSFSKEWVLRRHMRRHGEGAAGGAGSHDCPQCGRSFKQRKGLASHLRSHSGEKPFSCSACGQRFARPESASKHQRLHSGVKPHACPHCPKRFSRSDGLRSHLRTHAARQGPRPAAPPRPKPCVCPHCGKAYASAALLANHQRTHTGERPYECAQCHKRFCHAGALSAHRVCHQRQRPHACPSCAKRFRCAKHLKRHLLTHSELRPFACERCPLAFRSGGELRAHALRHVLQRTHGCPDCAKRFKTEYEVRLHRRAHSGERPYPCPDCPRAFRRPHHLTSHRLTHSGQRPHACALCPRSFIRARELRSHLRRVHLALEPGPARPPPRPTHEGLLEGLQKFPRILPRQARAEPAGPQRAGASADPGAQRGGEVLGPVVFWLAGQGGSIPVLASATVVNPMTTVAKIPIMPVSRAVSKTQRKGGRKASPRSSSKPGSSASPARCAPAKGGADSSMLTPPPPAAHPASAARTETSTRSSANLAPATPLSTPAATPPAHPEASLLSPPEPLPSPAAPSPDTAAGTGTANMASVAEKPL